MHDSIKSLGYIQFKTHSVHISHDLDRDHYVCFKSDNCRCDIDSFSDPEAAVDYILEPMPSLVYYLKLNGDSES